VPTTSDGGTSLVDRMMDVSGENQGASRDEIELELRAARLFLSRRQLPEARASLKRILAAEPDNRDAAELLGRALLDAGDSAGAQAALKSALEIHPGDERLEEVYASQRPSVLGRKPMQTPRGRERTNGAAPHFRLWRRS
jgi:thioredoxin-like negative regulator of GroEL